MKITDESVNHEAKQLACESEDWLDLEFTAKAVNKIDLRELIQMMQNDLNESISYVLRDKTKKDLLETIGCLKAAISEWEEKLHKGN